MGIYSDDGTEDGGGRWDFTEHGGGRWDFKEDGVFNLCIYFRFGLWKMVVRAWTPKRMWRIKTFGRAR